ncbi:MAG: inositol monophosphatase family protein [Pseudomonadota bacterium]
MTLRDMGPLDARQLGALLDLTARASAEIMAHYREASSRKELRQKADRTPLTEADLASHELLLNGLRGVTPEIPVLSEESETHAIEERLDWPLLWMLDPLDGTREFLDGTAQFTINLALIHAHEVSFGLIFYPNEDCAYLGAPGYGAYRAEERENVWHLEPLVARPLPDRSLTLLASHRHRNETLGRCISWVEQRYALVRENFGSAVKFCELAKGAGDWYPRFSPCSEWDVAAGDALVTAAGGAVYTLDGSRLRYNARNTLESPHFLAVADAQTSVWAELLEFLKESPAPCA